MQGQDVQVSPGYTQDAGFLARMQGDLDGAAPERTQEGLGANRGALIVAEPKAKDPSGDAPKAARPFRMG